MNAKLFKAGAWLANGNDNVAQATKLVVRGTKDGVRSFIAGYKEQRAVNKRHSEEHYEALELDRTVRAALRA